MSRPRWPGSPVAPNTARVSVRRAAKSPTAMLRRDSLAILWCRRPACACKPGTAAAKRLAAGTAAPQTRRPSQNRGRRFTGTARTASSIPIEPLLPIPIEPLLIEPLRRSLVLWGCEFQNEDRGPREQENADDRRYDPNAADR